MPGALKGRIVKQIYLISIFLGLITLINIGSIYLHDQLPEGNLVWPHVSVSNFTLTNLGSQETQSVLPWVTCECKMREVILKM